jgi:hypothetical protein
MIYAIYQYGFRKVVFRVLEVYMFWHLQFLVTQFAIIVTFLTWEAFSDLQ